MIEHVGTLSAEQFRELYAGEKDPFETWTNDLEWRGKDLFTTKRNADGRLIAAVGLVVADVEAGGRTFPVAGVGGVIVSHDHRGQGHLRPVLEGALERAATLGPDHALLFCSDEKARIYARFGFRVVEAPVYAAQPGGERQMPPPAMWRPLREGASWPDGPVRLPELPF